MATRRSGISAGAEAAAGLAGCAYAEALTVAQNNAIARYEDLSSTKLPTLNLAEPLYLMVQVACDS